MKHRITILTLSRKWGGKCVAGYDHDEQRVVRLVSNTSGRQLDNSTVSELDLLDVVEADIVCECPLDHQTENVLLNVDRGIAATRDKGQIEEFQYLCRDDGKLFGTNWYKIDDASDLDHSFELIKFSDMHIYLEDNVAKADFSVSGCSHRWYRITDNVHEHGEYSYRHGYAVVTLPPHDAYSKEHGLYKYISAIYPLP